MRIQKVYMKFLIFIIVYPLIWIISKLPFRVLYFLSDFFFLIVYYIVGYRKKIVFDNLKTAFPNKSNEELNTLTKKALRHFTDFIFETIKTFTISEKEIKKRFKYKNLKVLTDLEKEKRSVILMGAHYGNWEWIIYLSKLTSFLPIAAYTKIGNSYFEKVIKSSREKFGAIFVKTSNIITTIERNKKENKPAIYGFLSDQSPQLHKAYYWQNFLGAFVPVITGAEVLSKKHDFIIVNYNVTRVKRGFYEIDFEVLTKTPRDFEDYQITDIYLKKTEENIKKQPEFYLWTHKRFKHKNRYNEWLDIKKPNKK